MSNCRKKKYKTTAVKVADGSKHKLYATFMDLLLESLDVRAVRFPFFE